MKCLSVSQPFADLIISGKKTIELRNWNTNFRGEFLIHAPIKIRTEDAKRLKINKKLVTGAIVGKAELYKVKKYESLKPDFDEMNYPMAAIIGSIAKDKFQKKFDIKDAYPIYVRNKVAQTIHERNKK